MKEIEVTSDVQTSINIVNIEMARDIPGGASVELASLIAGNVIPQGTPLSAPSSGKRYVCKQAVCLAGSTTTVKKVATGSHNFKVGDFLCTKEGGLAYAITTITTSNGVDDITVDTAIEANAAGTYIYQALAEAAAVDASLNIAYAAGTSTGLTGDTTSDAVIATMPGQSTKATIAGTTTEPGDATVTVSSDLFDDEVVTVAIADNDTPAASAAKMRMA